MGSNGNGSAPNGHGHSGDERGEPAKLPIDFLDEILARISNGATLRGVCRDLDAFGAPAASTVRSWVVAARPPGTAERYARARELQLEAWADEIHELATKPQIGEKTETDASGNVIKITTGDTVDRSRLAVDTRKWLMSKLAPKKYGDNVTIDPGGAGRRVVVTLAPSDQDRSTSADALRLMPERATNGNGNGNGYHGDGGS